ncbi:MAG: cobyric acid synthase [Fibrobacter sp.]|nr:cobyric acid synthase [Fibrobacter sp.]
MTSSLMIQGTASSSGKSLITAALCRILHQDGYKVAPFKAQNMSNNSFVTHDGLEMGRAQVVQAYASGLEPDVRMNPVLLKPSSDTGSQVVLKGKPVFTMDAKRWHETRNFLRETVRECYESLAAEYDTIIIEGAGSPAEINLKKNDIVNMGMAKMADAPVVIVGDIDRGGVFASLVGTMQLLEPDERARVKGFIINKFRGDIGLLKPGLDKLEQITNVPVLGVVPWINHAIDDEDGVAERFHRKEYSPAEIDICIIRLPHISNFTDFIPLETIPGVRVRWCYTKEKIGSPDLLILPGTKATIADVQAIRKCGIEKAIVTYANNGGTVMGICGGFQMLGVSIEDPSCAESASASENGLGLLDMRTTFHSQKRTAQTTVTIYNSAWPFCTLDGVTVDGYEIHMGQSSFGSSCIPFTTANNTKQTNQVIGAANKNGRIFGTYCHGIFDKRIVLEGVVNALRKAKRLAPISAELLDRQQALELDLTRLAETCRKYLDMQKIMSIIANTI